MGGGRNPVLSRAVFQHHFGSGAWRECDGELLQAGVRGREQPESNRARNGEERKRAGDEGDAGFSGDPGF